jgi:hypothetical protein
MMNYELSTIVIGGLVIRFGLRITGARTETIGTGPEPMSAYDGLNLHQANTLVPAT